MKPSFCLNENINLFFSVNSDEFSRRGVFVGSIFYYEKIVETDQIIDPYFICEDGEQGDELYSVWF